MSKTSGSKVSAHHMSVAAPVTLATVLAGLERPSALSVTRRRDLRSATKRVAHLLGNEPVGLLLDMAAIAAQLSAIDPLAAGMTAKRFANVRSDFVAAVKASGLMPAKVEAKKRLSPAWIDLFSLLSGRRAHIGLSRFAHYASAQGIEPRDVADTTIGNFVSAVRASSLHQNPKALHRQVTRIWNEAASDSKLGLCSVTVASFRGPPKRADWSTLPASFRHDVDDYLSWAGKSDPFAADARPRALAPRTLRLRRAQIHAAATALIEAGTKPATLHSLAHLVTPPNLKSILRRRLEIAGETENNFNRDLGINLVLIAREWVKVEAPILAELKRLVSKLPAPVIGMTNKNKRFLRQFDDPKAFMRLVALPKKLWAEVRRDDRPSFRTLAKAQAALAIAILTYIPLRLHNLSGLKFDAHLFLRTGAGAISTLELSREEVKNKTELAFDIPPQVAQMLLEYRERIAPKIIGHRPSRLFINADGTPKSPATVAWLISTYAKRCAGIAISSHQFRHLGAKILLDDQPGAFESVKQLLGHKRHETTVNAYAGIDSRRAARHHRRLIENAIASQDPLRRLRRHRGK